MSKIKKADLLQLVQEQADMIVELSGMVKMNKLSIIKLENEREQKKLKQLDQSIFDGLDEQWQWAAFSNDGCRHVYLEKPRCGSYWEHSLIERESKELTGSDLCRKMLERGDKYVMCKCWCNSYADIELVVDVVSGFAFELGKKAFAGARHNWDYAVPINNQGEPLTAADVGL